MRILKTLVLVGPNSGEMMEADTIEHEGKLWLVPTWIVSQDRQWLMPARIIRMDVLDHKPMHSHGVDYLLTSAIPKEVLSGQSHSESGVDYEVIESPPIRRRNVH